MVQTMIMKEGVREKKYVCKEGDMSKKNSCHPLYSFLWAIALIILHVQDMLTSPTIDGYRKIHMSHVLLK